MMKLPNLNESRLVIVDCETTGVDWKRDQAVGYVVCVGPSMEDVWYLPVRHQGGGNLDAEQVERWLSKLLSDPARKVANHNLKFDLHMMANQGIAAAGPLECTQVNAALLDENAKSFSLDALAQTYNLPYGKETKLYEYLAGVFGGEPDKKQASNIHKLSGEDPNVVQYAKMDGLATWHLLDAQQIQLDNQELRPVWNVECRALRTLFRMERRGVVVDEAKLDWLDKYLDKVLQRAESALPKGFNVRSGPQVLELMKRHGVTGWPVTAKGNASFPESWLETNDPGRRVIAVRKITNLKNSFINPLRERHLVNGRVHTTYNQLKQDEYGVVTGRLSSSNPNLQQVPKRDKILAPLFRQIFLPEPGHRWRMNDYSQQEFRVFADYTGASLLIDGYNSDPPVDIHTTVARLLNVERDPTAKRTNLGLVYGMGKRKLAVSLGISEEEATRIWNTYDQMIPEARKFLKAAEYWARARGWVRTKLYRRRRFPDRDLAHKAGNSIIQGTSADITKLKMVEVDEYFQSEKADSCLMLQVHDELDWSSPEGEEVHDAEARRIMGSFGEKDAIQMRVKMEVEHHEEEDWGRATFPNYAWQTITQGGT
jgi:DNA polymerase-1